MDKELVWENFASQIGKLKVFINVIEHSSEVQINNYKKLANNHDSEIKRYHHGINFVQHNYIDNKHKSINIETKSFNIKEYLDLLEIQQNNQYKWVITEAYEEFKKFIKKIFGNGNEINILINNNYIDVYHDAFKINLFDAINIIRIMRNKISHNELVFENDIYKEVENIFTKYNININNTSKKKLKYFIQKFTDANKGIVVMHKKLEQGGFLNRIGILIDCLLSYSYHIKETKT